MHRITLIKILTLLLLIVTISVNAQHETVEKAHVESDSSEKGSLKTEIKEYINHHPFSQMKYILFDDIDKSV